MDRLTGQSKLACDDIGTGEPALLLLPGWCADRGIFVALANQLGKKRRVINVDLLGHNESARPDGDFGSEDVIHEALKLVDSLGINEFVTVSVAHAGWLAVELRRRLVNRIPKMVFLDWIIIEPPQVFFEILEKIQQPAQWQSARDALFAAWSLGDPNLAKPFQEFMTNYGFDMWSRAGREIGRSYREFGSALRVLETLNPAPTVLNLYSPTQAKNLYAQDDDSSYFEAQQSFALNHPWFHFRRLSSKSHLPSVEVPGEVADAIESFIAKS
ncbi:alpha/beta fold hydrolase [Fischerella sp. PCC 9605]|uniref:alpha/beta fold hydrolase n=1 Tax=Fischerella sp. PCC 9605 TaxID=1173024 RepID=UPI00047D07DB|nr:alpha/beta hydrolase [Fischerella sp. PCC 9605]